MSDWRETLKSYVSPTPVPHEVAGIAKDFFAVSVELVFSLNRIGRPLMAALAVFMRNREKDSTQIARNFGEGGAESPTTGEEHIFEAISPELAKVRHDQELSAVNSLVTAFDAKENRRVLARVIMNSMRNEGFPPKPTEAELDEFLEIASPSAFIDMLLGVWHANKGLFGGAAEGKVGKVLGKLIQSEELTPSTTAPDASDDKPTEG
jgi:hypothetical protein